MSKYFKLFVSFLVIALGFALFYLRHDYGLLTFIPGAILGAVGILMAWSNLPGASDVSAELEGENSCEYYYRKKKID